jgi:hypothetical protein
LNDSYVFTDTEPFEKRISEGGFVEWTEFLGNYYGSPSPDPDAEQDVVFEIEVVASQNTRSRRSITKDLPRGIEKITPTGMPVCRAGLPLDLAGCCHTTGHFVFRAPDLEEGLSACGGCALREGCIRPGAERRHVRIAFDRLPWLDPALPQLSKTFARMAAARTVIERIHNLMKYEYGSPRLHQRGTASVQATLDKTLWAMHVVLARG